MPSYHTCNVLHLHFFLFFFFFVLFLPISMSEIPITSSYASTFSYSAAYALHEKDTTRRWRRRTMVVLLHTCESASPSSVLAGVGSCGLVVEKKRWLISRFLSEGTVRLFFFISWLLGMNPYPWWFLLILWSGFLCGSLVFGWILVL